MVLLLRVFLFILCLENRLDKAIDSSPKSFCLKVFVILQDETSRHCLVYPAIQSI